MSRKYRSSHYIYRIGYALLACFFIGGGLLLNTVNGRANPGRIPVAVGVGGCPVFPANNVWNRDISTLPVHPNSANYINSIGPGFLHPDFGSGTYQGEPIGMPYLVVPGNQPAVPVHFAYAAESDPGPYPIPANVPIEGGPQSTGDRHVIVINNATCTDYEMFDAYPQANGSWQAGSGAVWNLNSNQLRPAGWTSADAAGLPILPGLVRYDEIVAGVITHAIRCTVNQTQKAYIWPARHFASSNSNPNLPPMGLRLRLKANVNISSFSRTDQIILTALKHYGMIVADNGASWFISGAPDDRWNNDELHALTTIPGSDFEAVDESSLEINPATAQAAGALVVNSTPAATHSPIATSTLTPKPTSTARAVIPVAPLPTNVPSSNPVLPTQKEQKHTTGSPLLWSGIAVAVVALIAGGLFLYVWQRRCKSIERNE